VPLNVTGLDALLAPRSIAVFGASSDPTKIGGRPITFLRQNGFTGEIYPINPKHAEVQGLPAYAAITEIDRPVDLALISVPSASVIAAVEACAKAGVQVATVFSAGFAEAAENGAEQQALIAEIARDAGMRILGPNCLGSSSRRRGVSASFAASEGRPQPDGNLDGVALVSQSGAIAAYCVLAGMGRGINFDPWISTGNECDIQLADCVAYLAEQDDVKVIAAYVEGCSDGDRLREALAIAYERHKPVIMLKAGRSEVGVRAVASHTASLVGSNEAFDALVRQYNVCSADSLDDLMDLSYMFGFGAPPTGRRTGVITSSGGVGILMADAAADIGLDVPPLPPQAQAALREVWPAAGTGNPIDTTAQLVNDGELLSKFLQTVLRDGGFDSLIVFLSYIGLIPDWAHAAVEALQEARASYPDADISLAMLTSPPVRKEIEALGIRVFDDPTTAVRAIGRAVVTAERSSQDAPLRPRPSDDVTARTAAGRTLSELESAQLLEAAGLPIVPRRRVTSVEQAKEAAHDFTGPMAVKILSADILHKSDIGGVILGVVGADAAARAYTSIIDSVRTHAPDAELDGVLVSPMVPDGIETIIGVSNDPVFGPVVMFGLGGVFVETLKDVSCRLAPFTESEAMQMLREIKGYRLLEGARGGSARDVPALATALSALSRFADEHRDDIQSVDLNPVLVLGEGNGVVAVDALVVETE
jgi:acyl-CoA synthetase (NDP forming)